ncbi:MAG: FUSC family protein [Finegoldia sp.]|nr:FUSC family protein [Finegoldia sp.]
MKVKVKKIKVKKPGLRIIKTSLAVFLSMLISYLRSPNATPFYSAIAAVICTKPAITESVTMGKNRILGTLIGSFMGLIYLLITEDLMIPDFLSMILLSLSIGLLIWIITGVANIPKSVTIACVVFLSITINHAQTDELALYFALNRTLDTLIGIIVAVVVNMMDPHVLKEDINELPSIIKEDIENIKDGWSE